MLLNLINNPFKNLSTKFINNEATFLRRIRSRYPARRRHMLIPKRLSNRFLIRTTRRLHLQNNRKTILSSLLTINRRTTKRSRRPFRTNRSHHTIAVKSRRNMHPVNASSLHPTTSLLSLIIPMPGALNTNNLLLIRRSLRPLIMTNHSTYLRPLLPNQQRSHPSHARDRSRVRPLLTTRIVSRPNASLQLSIIRRLTTSSHTTKMINLLRRLLPILLQHSTDTIITPTMQTINTNRSHLIIMRHLTKMTSIVILRGPPNVNRHSLRNHNPNLIRARVRRGLTLTSKNSQ